MIAILLVVVGILVVALLVLNVYPAFGAKPVGKEKYANQIPTPMGMDLKTTGSLLRDFIKGNPRTKPADRSARRSASVRQTIRTRRGGGEDSKRKASREGLTSLFVARYSRAEQISM